MKNITFTFGTTFNIKDASNDALIAAVAKGFNVPAWMKALGTGSLVAAAPVAPNLAWAELFRREGSRKDESAVKSYISLSMKGKNLTMSADEVVCHAKDRDTPLVTLGGFLVPESLAHKETTKAAVALEVAIESVLFAQDSDPNSKRDVSTGVDPVMAEQLQVPIFPIIAAMGGESHKAADIEATMRVNEKKTPGSMVSFLTSNMPKTVPNGKDAMPWLGVAFEPVIIPRYPRVMNQDSMFQTVLDHRKVRGADTGRRSLYSKGYYFGYSDSPTYSAFTVVNDLENLVNTNGVPRFLQIDHIDGIFSDTVIQSLITNGWVIRVINALGFKSLDYGKAMELVKEGKLKMESIPGVYRRVTNCEAVFFVHRNIGEKTPTMIKTERNAFEVNLPVITEDLEELIHIDTGSSFTFSYVYVRDVMQDMTSFLFPTSHAHSGQVIVTNLKQKNPLDLYAYMKRILLANAYKTTFVYHRLTFWSRDPYRFKGKFNMYMKSKPKENAARWEVEDFNVPVIKEIVQEIKIDYESLRANNPDAVDRLMVFKGLGTEQQKNKVAAQMAENDTIADEREIMHQTLRVIAKDEREEDPFGTSYDPEEKIKFDGEKPA